MRPRCCRQGSAPAIFIAALIWAFSVFAVGANAAVISANNLPDDLAGWVEWLKEPSDTQAWSLKSALSAPETDWKPLTSSVLNFSFDPASYWFRFTLNNTADANIRLIFDVAQPLQDYIDAWILGDDNEHIQT